MRFLALACDYDGTLATGGRVEPGTVDALRRVRESGRKLVLVTGRELGDLLDAFPDAVLFDRLVGENGGTLYRPQTKETVPLAPPPDERLIAALRAAAVPLAIGDAVVATGEPHQGVVLETIRRLGLELEVVFNKGAVMVLPTAVNKASGLRAALLELGLSPHNAVAVGDAENDHTFLEACEYRVAVANALPALKERADRVTQDPAGAGVRELVELLLDDDLAGLTAGLARLALTLGGREEADLQVPLRTSLLVAGPSATGKSTFATALLEQLGERGYQRLVVDPEGDYRALEGATVVGDERRPPVVDETLELLGRPDQSVVVDLTGVAVGDRPAFFGAFFPRLLELRAATGRPHWMQIDEAHHLLPASWRPASIQMPQELGGLVLVTVRPDAVAPAVVRHADAVVAFGDDAGATLASFAAPADGEERAVAPPVPPPDALEGDTAVYWAPGSAPTRFRPVRAKQELLRHRRKYAVGELGPEDSFYFTGRDGRLHLRAQNLAVFLQTADGVDDDTWRYHLERHDVSRWMRERINDDELADAVDEVERDQDLSPRESRERVRREVDARYTAPA